MDEKTVFYCDDGFSSLYDTNSFLTQNSKIKALRTFKDRNNIALGVSDNLTFT